jgi:hypothetical protein
MYISCSTLSSNLCVLSRGGSSGSDLILVTCLACNKTLLAHRYSVHLGHCGRQASPKTAFLSVFASFNAVPQPL